MKLIVACAALLLSACGPNSPTRPSVEAGGPVHYGNGVYYFSNPDNFGNDLSGFIADNPTVRILAITGDGNGGPYGHDRGYYVVVEPR